MELGGVTGLRDALLEESRKQPFSAMDPKNTRSRGLSALVRTF
jgi:hypothetical protein